MKLSENKLCESIIALTNVNLATITMATLLVHWNFQNDIKARGVPLLVAAEHHCTKHTVSLTFDMDHVSK